MPRIVRALSVRQPYLELILRGAKRTEYRSRPTKLLERVYLYASTFPAPDEAFIDAGLNFADLTTGLILGSVEIVGCESGGEYYEWRLARPERLARPLKPKNRPQPVFFFPFGD